MLGNLQVRFGVGDGVESVLHHENRILREKLGHKRLILNESQKRRLATAAANLGRDALRQIGTLFSPETILRWHRWLIARKYDGSGQRRRGPVAQKANQIRKLLLRMAEDNASLIATLDIDIIRRLAREAERLTLDELVKKGGIPDRLARILNGV